MVIVRRGLMDVVFTIFCFSHLRPSPRSFSARGPDVVPSEDYSHWPPAPAARFVKGQRSPKQIKTL
jgi:hypothetical protein